MRRAAITGNGCLSLLAGFALACSEPPPPDTSGTGPAHAAAVETAFAPELGIQLDSMTHIGDGVYIQDVLVGTGTGAVAEAGSTVTVDYRAWLSDGTLYEQRPDDRGFGSAEMVIGEITPAGLNDGLAGMRARGIRRVVIPPARGYGLVGRPANVPAGSTLIYEVRLRSVE